MDIQTTPPQRREELIDLAVELGQKLQAARIESTKKSGWSGASNDAVYGVPASHMGTLTAFLRGERDLKKFRRFLGHIADLDRLTAQNQRTVKFHYRPLKKEVQRLLDRSDPSLTAEECLYLLSWTQRLLPKKSQSLTEMAEEGKTQPKGNIAKDGALTSGGPKEVHDVRVFPIPGQKALETRLPGQRKAEADPGDVDALLKGISDELRERLLDKRKARKGISMKVTVQQLGNRWKIIGLGDPS